MSNITSKLADMISATRIVLLMFSGVTCIGFLAGKISETVFMAAVTMVLGFYFGQKIKPPTANS